MVDDLPTGYYLDNFLFLIDFVHRRYDDVLSEAERSFHTDFHVLSLSGQRLYVRLISRKGPYFRTDKLRYDEISDIAATLVELCTAGFVSSNHEVDAECWLQLATRTELIRAFDVSQSGLRKGDLCAEIIEATDNQCIQQQLPFDLVEPLHQQTLRVYRLLFFGNLYQDLTDFVLRDLGITPFEQYPLDPAARYFDKRPVIEQMLAAYELQEMAEAVMASPEQSLAEFAECHLMQLNAEDAQLKRRHSKILNRVARQLERESEPELALSLYEKSLLAPARERRARLLVSADKPDQAVHLCKTIAQAPDTEAEYEFAIGFAHRQAGRYCLDVSEVPLKPEENYLVETAVVPQVPDQRVEMTVADWLDQQTPDTEGAEAGGVWYVENGLLPGLFGLYFWDVIFSPVRGAFFNPFQRGPVDLFEPGFSEQRSRLLAARFADMDDRDAMRQTILQNFEVKYGLANHFVSWRVLSPELITLALDRIPVAHLTVVFRRLLRDLKQNRSGFPDLIHFPVEGSYEMIEVKGPGDALQANQKRWLRFFQTEEIPARVLNIVWQT